MKSNIQMLPVYTFLVMLILGAAIVVAGVYIQCFSTPALGTQIKWTGAFVILLCGLPSATSIYFIPKSEV